MIARQQPAPELHVLSTVVRGLFAGVTVEGKGSPFKLMGFMFLKPAWAERMKAPTVVSVPVV
jgi:hypothetical protein